MILKSGEFRHVFQNGRSIKNEYFSFYFVKSNELKVGFAASKYCKNKPVRNRVKRIARELWRLHYNNYSLSIHTVIIASARLAAVNHNLREKAFLELLSTLEKADTPVE